MVNKTKEALELAIEAMEKSKRPHAYCEDTWYSCPKHEEGCADVRQGDECNCGADSVNLKLQKPINACKEALAELQQQSAMQQLEIMRLRKALSSANLELLDVIDSINQDKVHHDGDDFHETLNKCDKALSTPATYDDLMAWHNEQLGEPVAWFHEDYPAERYGDLEEFEYDYGSTDKARPLYAKKG